MTGTAGITAPDGTLRCTAGRTEVEIGGGRFPSAIELCGQYEGPRAGQVLASFKRLCDVGFFGVVPSIGEPGG